MDAFDFFFQGKFKILAQESGLNSVLFITQSLITSFSVFVTIVITYDTFFKDIHIITFLVILLGIILGFILKLIAFGFIKNKKNIFYPTYFHCMYLKYFFLKVQIFLIKTCGTCIFCGYFVGIQLVILFIG